MKIRDATMTYVESDPAVAAMADKINTLGDLPPVKGPATAYTETGAIYQTFQNGHRRRESEMEPPRIWALQDMTVAQVCDMTFEAIVEHFKDIPQPRRVVWRSGPELSHSLSGGTGQLYLRLVIEHVEEAAPEPSAPVSLAAARAIKAQDSQLWSPADALRHVLGQIESGECAPTKIAIDYFVPEPDGGYRHHYAVAGLSVEGRIAMLQAALTRAINEWFR